MKEIVRRVALLERVGTIVLPPSGGRPSANNVRGLRPSNLSTVSGTLSRPYLVSDDETHGITRPVLAAVHPG